MAYLVSQILFQGDQADAPFNLDVHARFRHFIPVIAHVVSIEAFASRIKRFKLWQTGCTHSLAHPEDDSRQEDGYLLLRRMVDDNDLAEVIFNFGEA